ncbi:MAG TPA: hypothetical protein VNS32_14700 [Flavisolibacter sp.]|nr:hypothetical protein [Flavisolibacter sp.]
MSKFSISERSGQPLIAILNIEMNYKLPGMSWQFCFEKLYLKNQEVIDQLDIKN